MGNKGEREEEPALIRLFASPVLHGKNIVSSEQKFHRIQNQRNVMWAVVENHCLRQAPKQVIVSFCWGLLSLGFARHGLVRVLTKILVEEQICVRKRRGRTGRGKEKDGKGLVDPARPVRSDAFSPFQYFSFLEPASGASGHQRASRIFWGRRIAAPHGDYAIAQIPCNGVPQKWKSHWGKLCQLVPLPQRRLC